MCNVNAECGIMNKSTLLAVVVFVGLAVATVFTLRGKPERGITRLSFRDVKPESVTAVVIEGPNPVELRRQDGAWLVGSKRADESAVTRLLDAVPKMESSDLVTRNEGRFAELEVEGEKATRVKLLAGGTTLADFFVGTASTAGSHIRVGNAVYSVAGAYRNTFSRPRSGWLDLALFHDTADNVQRVEVKLRGEAPYALVRENDQWRLETPPSMPEAQRFDRSAAQRLANSLATARAADIPEQAPGNEVSGLTDGADTLIFAVNVKEGESATRSLQLGSDGDKDQVYARASTRDEVVMLPKYVAANLRKKLADLRDMTLLSLDTAKADRLELVEANRQLVFERSNGAWRIEKCSEEPAKDFQLDGTLVQRRLSELAGVRAVADAPVAVPKMTGLDKPTARAAVTLEDGQTVALEFGKETKWNDQPAVFARGNADSRIYLVPTRDRDRLVAGLGSFVKREPTSGLGNLSPEALRNLPPEVRENLLRQLAEQQQRQRLLESLQSGQSAGGK
jgi:hypothetical protein